MECGNRFAHYLFDGGKIRILFEGQELASFSSGLVQIPANARQNLCKTLIENLAIIKDTCEESENSSNRFLPFGTSISYMVECPDVGLQGK